MLRSKPIQRNCLLFSKTQKTQYTLRVNELNLLHDMLPLQIVLHYEVKINQNMAKESLLGVSRRVLTCILTLKLRKTHICVFREDFSYSCFFYQLLLLLEIKTKLIRFCTTFAGKKTSTAKLLAIIQNYKTHCALQE